MIRRVFEDDQMHTCVSENGKKLNILITKIRKFDLYAP